MNLSKLFNIDRTVCLTLDKRYEDALKIEAKGYEYGLNIELFLAGDGQMLDHYDHVDTDDLPPRYTNSTNYATWWNRPNAYNAWKCHKKILQKAKQDGIEQLLLLEDDAFFENDLAEVVTNAYKFLQYSKWDMLYFGWYSNNHLKPTINTNVWSMHGGAGFHGVLLTKEMIDLFAEFDACGPFDWMAGHAHNAIKAFAIYPSVITQKSGHSYVEGGNLEKPHRNKR